MNLAHRILASASIFAFLAPSVSFARVLAPATQTIFDLSVITNVKYRGTGVYIPGKWRAESTDLEAAFLRETATVRFKTIPRPDCEYQTIRIKAQKAWGKPNLLQSDAQIKILIVGKSDYRGYQWIVPDKAGAKEYHWCLAQDAKSSVEAIASGADATTVAFFNSNLPRQLAVRKAAR